jgi:hypothetical protein
MQETIASTSLTDLQAAILRTIVYSDLFDFPLTSAEVQRWLSVPATKAEVESTLGEAPLAGLVSRSGSYVTLRGREAVLDLRERRADSSAALQQAAERYGRLIGRLPFVRMVALTGSLAADNADAGDDIDYLIVTAPGRVWTARTMIMAIGRLAALRGVTLCPNYLLSETGLDLRERDSYTARELLQMRPIVGSGTYVRMLAANAWWREFLPNAGSHPPTPSPKSERGPEGEVSLPRRAVESLLRLPPFDTLERWILARKGAELRRHASGTEAVFDETMCKGHFDAWKERTRRRLEERMQELERKLEDSSRGGEWDSSSTGPKEPSP